MRSVQSVSSLAHGERLAIDVASGGVAFGVETINVVSAGTMLAAWSNGAQLKAGVYGDGSVQVTVQGASPTAPVDGQWWFEDVGGIPVLVVHHNGVNTVLGTPSGSAVGVTSIAGNAGILASSSTGAVGLAVDFAAVAHAVHTHAYLALDGSNAMTGPVHTIDGTYMNPAVHGSDPDTGIFFGPDFVAFSAAGGMRAKITPLGLELSNYRIPSTVGDLNDILAVQAGGVVGWTPFVHSMLGGIGEDDHHPRRHAMTDVSDHYASTWQMFYSDHNGDVQEIGMGPSGYALIAGGPTSAPAWGAVLAKPSRGLGTIGYNFADSTNTGMTADANGVYLYLSGTSVLDVNLSRLRVGPSGSRIDYPVVRGNVGQVLTQQASGVAGWTDPVVSTYVPPAVNVEAYHRMFMFRN